MINNSVLSATSVAGKVSLDQQAALPKYRTPEHLTTYPNERISRRVALAIKVATEAAALAESDGVTLKEALLQTRVQHGLHTMPSTGSLVTERKAPNGRQIFHSKK